MVLRLGAGLMGDVGVIGVVTECLNGYLGTLGGGGEEGGEGMEELSNDSLAESGLGPGPGLAPAPGLGPELRTSDSFTINLSTGESVRDIGLTTTKGCADCAEIEIGATRKGTRVSPLIGGVGSS